MKDRLPRYPGRVKLNPVAGQANTYDLVRADQPTEEGTAISKATLLSDATAAKLWPAGQVPANPVVDLALGRLGGGVLYNEWLVPKYTERRVTISSCAQGDIVYLIEGGVAIPFYIAKHNYESGLNGNGRTLLVRKDCYDSRQWHTSDVNAYASSAIDTWLNGPYKSLFLSAIQTAMGTTKFSYTPGNGNNSLATLQRAVFLLSVKELSGSGSNFNDEGSVLPIAPMLTNVYLNGATSEPWTRSPSKIRTDSAFILRTSGVSSAFSCTATYGSRPIFTLPASLDLVWYTDSNGSVFAEQAYDTESTITDLQNNPISIHPGIKLMEINDKVGGSNQFNINLTGIRLTDYAYIELRGNFSGYVPTYPTLTEVHMRLNGIATRSYAWGNKTSGYQSDMMILLSSAGYLNGSFCSFNLRIYAESNFIVADSYEVGFCNYDESNLRPHQAHDMGVCISPEVTPATLSQINFYIPESSGKTFIPGTKITLYGVKA